LQSRIAARQAKASALVHSEATRHRDRLAARLKLAAPHELPMALVPASTLHSTALPARRRRLFREHLETILARLAQTPVSSRTPLPPDERADAVQFHAEAPAAGAACATCRGYCCHGGGVKAYLNDETLQRFAEAHPSLDRKQIVRAYVSRLPKRSMKDSCVFHGEQGCTLGRDMRAAICNNYHCAGLLKLQAIDAGPVMIAATTEVDVVRCVVFANERITPSMQPGANTRSQARRPARRATAKTSSANKR
jgi:hypothetical protein